MAMPVLAYVARIKYLEHRADKKVMQAIQSNYWQKMCKSHRKTNKMDRVTVFIGDSLTELFDLSVFHDSTIINRGICGDFSYGVLQRVDEIARHNPSKIFIEIGINDIREEVPLSKTISNYESIVNYLRQKLPDAKIFIQSDLPTSDQCVNDRVLELNRLLIELSRNYKVEYIDLHSHFVREQSINPALTTDGVHLNESGYQIWYDVIRKHVLM